MVQPVPWDMGQASGYATKEKGRASRKPETRETAAGKHKPEAQSSSVRPDAIAAGTQTREQTHAGLVQGIRMPPEERMLNAAGPCPARVYRALPPTLQAPPHVCRSRPILPYPAAWPPASPLPAAAWPPLERQNTLHRCSPLLRCSPRWLAAASAWLRLTRAV